MLYPRWVSDDGKKLYMLCRTLSPKFSIPIIKTAVSNDRQSYHVCLACSLSHLLKLLFHRFFLILSSSPEWLFFLASYSLSSGHHPLFRGLSQSSSLFGWSESPGFHHSICLVRCCTSTNKQVPTQQSTYLSFLFPQSRAGCLAHRRCSRAVYWMDE